MKKIILLAMPVAALLAVLFYSGPRNSEQGIEIPHTLYAHQDNSENRLYRKLIKGALRGDAGALAGLINFDCGGAAGCYDQGAVLLSIAIRAGDIEFAKVASQLSEHDRQELEGFLSVGVEYGGIEGLSEWKEFETRFPALNATISGKLLKTARDSKAE